MQVMFEGILLKPSMVTPGADSSKREKPEVVADYTLKLLRRRVPPAVPGETFRVLGFQPECWSALSKSLHIPFLACGPGVRLSARCCSCKWLRDFSGSQSGKVAHL